MVLGLAATIAAVTDLRHLARGLAAAGAVVVHARRDAAGEPTGVRGQLDAGADGRLALGLTGRRSALGRGAALGTCAGTDLRLGGGRTGLHARTPLGAGRARGARPGAAALSTL